MQLQLGDTEVVVLLAAAVHREELYGKQSRTVEKDGEVLEKVVLDPEGNAFLPADVTYLSTDGQGSLTGRPQVQTEHGEILPDKPSSFKEKRALRVADVADLARLRVDAVFPVRCDLPPGLYCTEFTYRDAPVLKDAVLNVTPEGAFLLTGTFVDAEFQGKGDVYRFFDDDEEEIEEEEDEGEISFAMF